MREVGGTQVALLLAALLLAVSLCGCLVDADAPCGAQLRVNTEGTCVCPEGSTASGGGCVPALDESIGGSAGASSECEAGSACACTSSADCAPGELCDRYASKLCVAAPAGLGISCSKASDCAGSEATFCDSFATHTCQVQGCTELAGVCPGDLVCCHYAVLGTSLCVSTDVAPDGSCPAPGQLVPRTGAP